MAQNPLPPPPPSGGVLDGWLYLLWRRLTQTGQILWDSITPGTSADVAAVVTDETGSPGSLVFSGNPTLAGVNVATGDCNFNVSSSGTLFIGDVSNEADYKGLSGGSVISMLITSRAGDTARNNIHMYIGANNTTPNRWRFVKGRGGTSHGAVVSGDSIYEIQSQVSDGTAFLTPSIIRAVVSGAVSTGVSPVDLVFLAGTNSSPTEALRITSTQRVVSAKTIATGGYTVATLPTGTVGDRAYVTDALAPAYGVAVAGSGAVTVPVFYNGAAWICA